MKNILSKENIQKAADEGACLQRIQEKVWDYMELPKHKRNGVEMANDIFEDVKNTINKQQ